MCRATFCSSAYLGLAYESFPLRRSSYFVPCASSPSARPQLPNHIHPSAVSSTHHEQVRALHSARLAGLLTSHLLVYRVGRSVAGWAPSLAFYQGPEKNHVLPGHSCLDQKHGPHSSDPRARDRWPAPAPGSKPEYAFFSCGLDPVLGVVLTLGSSTNASLTMARLSSVFCIGRPTCSRTRTPCNHVLILTPTIRSCS